MSITDAGARAHGDRQFLIIILTRGVGGGGVPGGSGGGGGAGGVPGGSGGVPGGVPKMAWGARAREGRIGGKMGVLLRGF